MKRYKTLYRMLPVWVLVYPLVIIFTMILTPVSTTSVLLIPII